jgi:arylformamidase
LANDFPDKKTYSALAEGAVSHGLNVAVVEYTLAPEARMDWIVGEVRHGIGWLHEHLDEYGNDPGRICVADHSAGGHLTETTMPLGTVRGG